MAKRVGASSHGLYIALLHLGAGYIGFARLHGDQNGTPFFVLCLVAAVLVGYSFWAFRGNKHVHWLQAVNILWLFGLLFVGSMMVTGRWL